MTDETKTLIQKLGTSFEEFKNANDSRLKLIEKDAGHAELDEKVEKIDAAVSGFVEAKEKIDTAMKAQAERIDELEAELEQGGPQGKGPSKLEQEYAQKWTKWMRSCREGDRNGDLEMEADLRTAEKAILAEKAIDTTANASGGFAVPESIGRDIADQVRLMSPMRDLCKVVQVGTSDYKELVNIHGEGSAWVGETGTRNETATPSFRERAPTMGTLYTYPRATEESMDDVFFDVASLLVDSSAMEFAIAESAAFLSGSGTNRPTGILNTAPLTTDDDASPPRSAEAIEYIPLDQSSPLSAITPDALIDLVYLLRSPYRQGSTWAMNSTLVSAIRKLKDTTNQYLWQPGLQAGEPSQLIGYPVRVLEAMDNAVAAARSPLVYNFPVLFGNFKRAYLIVDRVGTRITVDANITTPGYVKWYIRRRVGGIILDNNALKAGRYST